MSTPPAQIRRAKRPLNSTDSEAAQAATRAKAAAAPLEQLTSAETEDIAKVQAELAQVKAELEKANAELEKGRADAAAAASEAKQLSSLITTMRDSHATKLSAANEKLAVAERALFASSVFVTSVVHNHTSSYASHVAADINYVHMRNLARRLLFAHLAEIRCSVCSFPQTEEELNGDGLPSLLQLGCGSDVPHIVCSSCVPKLKILPSESSSDRSSKEGRECPLCRGKFTSTSEVAPSLNANCLTANHVDELPIARRTGSALDIAINATCRDPLLNLATALVCLDAMHVGERNMETLYELSEDLNGLFIMVSNKMRECLPDGYAVQYPVNHINTQLPLARAAVGKWAAPKPASVTSELGLTVLRNMEAVLDMGSEMESDDA